MKKFATLGLAVVAMLVAAAVALAQTSPSPVQLTGKVTPSKGGSKKKPKNAKLKLTFQVPAESQSTIKTVTYSLPKNIKLSGKGFPTCSQSALADGKKCSKKSKVGTGTATALLGTQPLNFTFDIYAGSSKTITLKLVTDDLPSFVAYFPGKIKGSKLTVNIPKAVQQPVPGAYSYVTSISAVIGAHVKKRVGHGKHKRSKTYYFAALNGCPAKKTHNLAVSLDLTANPNPPAQTPLKASATSPCRK